MGKEAGIILTAAICLAAVAVGALRKRAEWLLNVIMRAVLGTIVIYFVNMFCVGEGIVTGVGINAFTVLTSGILGFAGVAALFGIGFYQAL